MSMKEDWKMVVFIIVIIVLSVLKFVSPNGSATGTNGGTGFPVTVPELEAPGKHLPTANIESVRQPNKLTVDESGFDETASVPKGILPAESSRAPQLTGASDAPVPNGSDAPADRQEGTSGHTAATIAAAIAYALSNLFAPQPTGLKPGPIDDARQRRIEPPKNDAENPATLSPGAVAHVWEQDGLRDSDPQASSGSNDSINWRHGVISYVLRALGVHRDELAPLS